MWFVGLLVGLVLGAIFEGDDGAFVGAAIGAALGTIISLLRQKNVAPELEQRVSALEAAVQALRQQLADSSVVRTNGVETPSEPATAPVAATDDSPPVRAPVEPEPSAAPLPPSSEATLPSAPEIGSTWMPEMPEAVHNAWRWLSGGNALVRVGVVVLFFGVAFLLKYAYEHTHVPIELRLTGVALGACAMLVIGWRLRLRKQVYALAMQGGGVGVLYLTVFGAYRMFGLLPGELAFALLLAIAVISAFLAIAQNAQSLAVIGISGGFLAPVLASTGSGSHVMLFSYYAVLNLGIFAIALYKAWRPLNVLGFVFTFGIGTMWGARFYRDELFGSVEPFLALFSNRTIERHSKNVDYVAMQASIGVFVWGLAWWLFGGLHEIDTHVPPQERASVALLFLAGTCTAFSVLFGRGWWIARFPALALAPLMALLLTVLIFESGQSHPLAGYGLFAWPIAFVLHFLILRRDDKVRAEFPDRGIPEYHYLAYAHAGGVWLLACIGAWEIAWQLDHFTSGQPVWPLVGLVMMPAILLNIIASNAMHAAWPMRQHLRAYLLLGTVPVAIFLYGWSLYANWSSNGDPSPLPYLPFVNPLDIAQMLIFTTFIVWWRSIRESGINNASAISANLMWRLLGILAFIWLNCVLLRSLHHWSGMPYDLGAIVRSDLAQAALSIFWSVLALAAMLLATRRSFRWLWVAGAVLMAAVVIKLFVLDLASVGGVERIVLFIAVGVLMLVIGYFAPVPPRNMSYSMPEKA